MTGNAHQSGHRWEGWENGLRWTSARTLYNVADARWPADVAGAAERVARAVRHHGPAAARRVWFALLWLDWAPLLRGQGARFWRLDRARRLAAVARWEASRWRVRRRAWRLVRDAVAGPDRDPDTDRDPERDPDRDQSPSGA